MAIIWPIVGQPKTGKPSSAFCARQTSDAVVPNRWQVRVPLGRDPSTGRYRYVGRYVQGTKRDAQRAAAELIIEVDRGGHREEGRHTVNELLDRWMAHIEAQGRAESTLARYRSCINANIKPRLGAKAINKLGPADLDRYYVQLGRTGLTPLSVRKSHAILSAAFNQALRWGWLDTNPVLRSSPPTQRAREIHPPTREELRRLLEACANDHEDLGSLIYVATTTGARRGELCGLRWSDLDLDLATLTIARSISDANQLVAVKDTKTHQARRIALDPSTVKVLRAAHRRLAEVRPTGCYGRHRPLAHRLRLVPGPRRRPPVPTRPGSPVAFRALRDRLELGPMSPSTRCATSPPPRWPLAGSASRPSPAASAMPTRSITLRTYAHFLDAADREAAIAIGAALAGLQPASANRPSASSRARRGTTSRRPNRTDGSSRLATKS